MGGLEEDGRDVPAAVGGVDEVDGGRGAVVAGAEGDAGELDAAAEEGADAEGGADLAGAEDGFVAEGGVFVDDEVFEGEAGEGEAA